MLPVCALVVNVLHFVFFSFYDKKKFSSKKEQKTIDASEKVSTLSQVFLVHLPLGNQFLLQNVRAQSASTDKFFQSVVRLRSTFAKNPPKN